MAAIDVDGGARLGPAIRGRAGSAAYYAVFHFLIADATSNWNNERRSRRYTIPIRQRSARTKNNEKTGTLNPADALKRR